MKNARSCVLWAWTLAAASAASLQAFDWPAAGGTATIPAGETVTVTSTSDLNAAAACGEIVIPAGATLSFADITANATFAGRFSGVGTILARNAALPDVKAGNPAGSFRLTFTGDLSGFTGNLDCSYIYMTFNTAKSGTFPMKFVEQNGACVIFTGANTYANPIDMSGGANTGLQVLGDATLTGDITWRGGSIRGASALPPATGGTITGTITCPNNSIYIQNGIKMLGTTLSRGSPGGTLMADGGPLNLKAKIVNFTSLETYRGMNSTSGKGLITFLDEDLIPADCRICFGVSSYAAGGCIDLNGFDQRCAYITHSSNASIYSTPANTTIDSSSGPATLSIVGAQPALTFPGVLRGHASLRYASTSANTLSLTGGVHTTDGALRVTKGKLLLGQKAAFSNLSELEVSGTGELTIQTGNLNPGGVRLKLADSGKLTIDAGVVQKVDQATVNGTYLAPGVYTKDSPEVAGMLLGDGTIFVLNGEKTTEGATFTWVGGGADENFSTAANWEGGIAPTFDGTERLVLGGGTHKAFVDCEAKVYAIDVADSAKFTIDAVGTGRIVMGAGGFSFTNTSASAVILHSLFAPVELGELPQHWTVAANASIETTKPWTGRAGGSGAPLVIHAFGRINFWGDNSGLETTLVLTNCTTAASQPYVYNQKGLGATNRETWVCGCLPRFCTSRCPMTNNVPLRLRNNVTNAGHGYFNDDHATNGLWLDGLVTFYGGQSETYVNNNVHFRGGITMESTDLYTLRKPGSNTYIESPVRCAGTFAIDFGGTVHLMSAGNSWAEFDFYKTTVKCYVDGALPAAKVVKMSEGGVYAGDTTLNLNGFNQAAARLVSGLPVADKGTKTATITSETPATLTLSGSDASNDWGPFRFTGAVSLVYDKGGSFQMTNKLSTTSGTLDVRKGTVKFLKGAGWMGSEDGTNVVLRGGTIAVATGAGATAFGASQDVSTLWMRYEGGTLDVAEGERATVRTVLYTENGREKSLVPGVYWAHDTTQNVSASHKLDWISGKGSVRVLRSAIPLGTIMILR